jgi:hypothetical protein
MKKLTIFLNLLYIIIIYLLLFANLKIYNNLQRTLMEKDIILNNLEYCKLYNKTKNDNRNLIICKDYSHKIHDFVYTNKICESSKLSSYENYNLIICDDTYYITNISTYINIIDVENINDIITNMFEIIFKNLSITCSNGKTYTINNKKLHKDIQYFVQGYLIEYSTNPIINKSFDYSLNTLNTFYDKKKSENFIINEFNCDEKNKKMTGILYIPNLEMFFSYCLNKDGIPTIYHYSPKLEIDK